MSECLLVDGPYAGQRVEVDDAAVRWVKPVVSEIGHWKITYKVQSITGGMRLFVFESIE